MTSFSFYKRRGRKISIIVFLTMLCAGDVLADEVSLVKQHTRPDGRVAMSQKVTWRPGASEVIQSVCMESKTRSTLLTIRHSSLRARADFQTRVS